MASILIVAGIAEEPKIPKIEVTRKKIVIPPPNPNDSLVLLKIQEDMKQIPAIQNMTAKAPKESRAI